MKRVLITGVNGFVGQRLSTYLLANGVQVKGTYRNLTDFPLGIEPLIISDLCEVRDWVPLLKDVDTIFHLAAQTHGVKAGKFDKVRYKIDTLQKINVDTTQALANAAIQAGVKRFIYVSSIKVNGESTAGTPFSATDLPKPEDNYGISKWQAEQILQDISSKGKLELVIVRPPLIYGPDVKGNFLSLLRLCDSPWPLPFASIHNHRSLIYIDNLVSLLFVCGLHPQAVGQTFLVSDCEVSTSTLVSTIRRHLRRPSRLFPCPFTLLRAVATFCGRSEAFNRLVGSLQVDNQFVSQLLNWTPSVSFEQGIEETILAYKSNKFIFK